MNVLAALGVVVGGLSFGFAGFAFGLFATMSLALVAAPASVVPAAMLVADVLSATLLWEHRHELSLRGLRETPPFARWSPLLLVAGVLGGTLLLGVVSPTVGRLGLAALVVGFVVLQTRPGHRHGAERPVATGTVEATTFAAGLLDGWFGTGGVVVAAHLTWRRLPPRKFLAAILPYFFASDVVRVVSYALAGYWSRDVFALSLATAPFALAGYLVGTLLRRRVPSPALFRAVVLGLLVVYAVVLIVRTLAG